MQRVEVFRWAAVCLASVTLILFAWNGLLGPTAEVLCNRGDTAYPTQNLVSANQIVAFLNAKAHAGFVVSFAEALSADTWIAALCGVTLVVLAGAAWRPGRRWKACSIGLLLLASAYTWVHIEANELLMRAVLVHVEAAHNGGRAAATMETNAVHALRNAIWLKFALMALGFGTFLVFALEPGLRWYQQRRAAEAQTAKGEAQGG